MKLVKNIFWHLILLVSLMAISCNGAKYGEPVKATAYLLSSFKNFWNYWNEYVKLSRDFTAFDESENTISKDIFLKKLSTGGYLPLRLQSNDSLNYYKLCKIDERLNKDMSDAIKTCVNIRIQNNNMVNKPLPGFKFIDLNGRLYNGETCKGKIVVLNFWFIHCKSCVAEMPALNKLVNLYKNRNDIFFVGLAADSSDKLKTFLEKTVFNYAIVPDMQNYLTDTLKIHSYPTQVIINKKGMVVKVPEDYKELEIELSGETVK